MIVPAGMRLLASLALWLGAFHRPPISSGHWVRDPVGRQAPSGPWVIAHRGSSIDAPENTLQAFRLAAIHRADGVELDVRRCCSGELVVFHDQDLLRLAGSSLAIARTDLQTLKAFDLGGGERIPTLEEVLQDPAIPVRINVEIKADTTAPTGIEEALVRLLKQMNARHRVAVSSFNPVVLRRLKYLDPELPRGFLFDPGTHYRSLRHPYLAPLVRPHLLHPLHTQVTPSFVEWMHTLGYLVLAWTADEPREWERLARAKVDGIITNRPAELAHYLVDGGWRPYNNLDTSTS